MLRAASMCYMGQGCAIWGKDVLYGARMCYMEQDVLYGARMCSKTGLHGGDSSETLTQDSIKVGKDLDEGELVLFRHNLSDL